MPVQSLCVVACAVRRELIALLHTDAWPLLLSAAIGALIVVALHLMAASFSKYS
jgi:hypothetical protein